MRTCGLVSIGVLCLLALAACGNEDEIAAKVTEYKSLHAKYKAVNLELTGDKQKARQETLNKVLPLKAALQRAQRSEDKAAIEEAQAALNDAEAAANAVIEEVNGLRARVRDLKDKMAKIEKQILKLGGKVPKT